MTMMKTIEALARRSPERGNDEVGVLLMLNNHRVWMSVADGERLIRLLTPAVAAAAKQEAKRS